MWTGTVDADYNGIVLFDPDRLRARYGGRISEGTNLFDRLITTDEGDAVLLAGLIVPVLAIDAAGYEFIVRRTDEPAGRQRPIVVENGAFPLRVRTHLVIADLAVLREWMDGVGWQRIDVPPGDYAVTVRGFRELGADGREIVSAGYEFVLDPRDELPALTADTARSMQLLRQPLR